MTNSYLYVLSSEVPVSHLRHSTSTRIIPYTIKFAVKEKVKTETKMFDEIPEVLSFQ